MQIAHLLALSGLMLATSATAGGELDRNDVPSPCWEPCGPVVNISHACDAQTDNDRAELQCVCGWDRAATLIPLCEACIGYYRTQQHHGHDHADDHDDDNDDDDNDNDRHDNDAYDILTSCSLSTTTWNPAAATSVLSAVNASMTGSGNATASASASATGAGAAGTTTAAAAAAAAGTGGGRESVSTTGGSSGATGRGDSGTATGAVSAEGARVTDNAAPGVVGGRGAASFAAVVGVGFLALL